MSACDIYNDARPSLISYKIFGFTSMKNVFSGQPTFQWGWHVLCPIIAFATFLGVCLANAVNYRSRTLWFWTFVTCFREIGRLFSAIYADTRTPDIMDKIHRYDEQYECLEQQCSHTAGQRYLLLVYWLFVASVVACSVADIAFNGFSLANLYYMFFRYWSSLFPLIYLMLCYHVYCRFRTLGTRWRTDVMRSLADGSPVSHQTLESERLAHSQLCDLVKDLSLAFGPQLVSYLFCVFFEHLARFYFLTYHPAASIGQGSDLDMANNVKALEPLMFIVHSWIGVFLIAYLSDKVTESSKDIIASLRSIPIWKLPRCHSTQITLFMTQVQCSNTEITACGLFKVNKTILSSITMSLATYIIVVIQLSPTIKQIFIN